MALGVGHKIVHNKLVHIISTIFPYFSYFPYFHILHIFNFLFKARGKGEEKSILGTSKLSYY